MPKPFGFIKVQEYRESKKVEYKSCRNPSCEAFCLIEKSNQREPERKDGTHSSLILLRSSYFNSQVHILIVNYGYSRVRVKLGRSGSFKGKLNFGLCDEQDGESTIEDLVG